MEQGGDRVRLELCQRPAVGGLGRERAQRGQNEAAELEADHPRIPPIPVEGQRELIVEMEHANPGA